MRPLIIVLGEFRNKARCRHSQVKAQSLWRELKDRVSDRERGELFTAWDHALMDEGPAELDEVCDRLIAAQRKFSKGACE